MVVLFKNKFQRSTHLVSLLLFRLCHVRLCDPWTAACQAFLAPSPRACSNSYPLSQWCHPTIMSSVFPFSSCLPLLFLPSIFPSIRVFFNELALCIRWSKHWSFSFNINPSNDEWFPSGLIGLFSLQAKGLSGVESSPTPQFKRISSLTLSFLYGPTLTSIHVLEKQ